MLRKLVILLLLGLIQNLHAQYRASDSESRVRKVVVFPLSLSDSVVVLPHRFLVQGSVKVIFDSTAVLLEGRDYFFQSARGIVSIRKELIAGVLADSARHTMDIEYERLTFSLKTNYSLHSLLPSGDSTFHSSSNRYVVSRGFSAEDVFGPGLQRSGSIIRGLTVGSNRDLTLNSGFRLQMSGKIAAGLELAAALTDENVPIQPEGTTQTLRELDKVFIQLRNPSFSTTLGDFVYEVTDRDGGEFAKFSRKLQGASGTAGFKNVLGNGSSLDLSIAGASTRGKYTTNQIQGIEGNQGPYRLTGEEPGRRPIVIAGTERVYVNGLRMIRGETNDYTIDYSTGEIVFSPRRLVTNATRITVDFQYSDRQFVRNLAGASARFGALNNALSFSTSVTQEADDDQSPIETALNDTLRSVIASSGADRFLASLPGARFAGWDTVTQSPRGQYILRDTLLAGRRRPLLVYAPGDPEALYTCVFTFVDRMPADSLGYQKISTGGFLVAGLGRGEYLPIELLPVPQLRRMANGRVEYRPNPDFTLSAEYALSEHNLNRLAPGSSTTKSGGAYKILAEFRPKGFVVGGVNFGDLEVRITDRFVDGRFSSTDRYNDVEFARAWNIESEDGSDESLREAIVTLQPHRHLRVGASLGRLERTGSLSSTKWTFDGLFSDSSRTRISLASDLVRSENIYQATSTNWVRERGGASYQLWHLQPSMRFEAEDRRQRLTSGDSLSRGSFRFLEVAPGLTVLKTEPFAIAGEVQFRTEDSAMHGTLRRAFRAVTQLYEFRLQDWNSFSSSASLSLRKTELSHDFAQSGNVSTNTILVRSQSRYAPLRRMIDFDALYEFARERSTPMKRVFVRVPKGTGNFIYRGDTNQNGLPDESEFEQTRFEGDYVSVFLADEQLIPVSDVKVGIRFRVTPNRWLSQPRSPVEKILAALSSETVVRIEERGTDPDPENLSLLRLSRFLNDSTTISGTQLLTQDVHVFDSDPSLSMRFRFSEKRGFVRFVGNAERGYVRERSVRIRAQLLREIGNQTDIVNKADRLFTSEISPRRRDLESNELRTEFSYRPLSEWEVAFGTALSQVSNLRSGIKAEANLNDQFIRLTYSLPVGGQLRGEVLREEAQVATGSGTSSGEYPFEFTNGRVIGKTYQWRLAFDYRISQYIQLSVGYDGRLEGERPAVHTGRAEAKAFF